MNVNTNATVIRRIVSPSCVEKWPAIDGGAGGIVLDDLHYTQWGK